MFTFNENSLREPWATWQLVQAIGAGLEAAAQRQRLRAVEAVRAAVGPELALQIVLGNRIADQERHARSPHSDRRP